MSSEKQHKTDKVIEETDLGVSSLHKRHSFVGLSLALVVVGMLGLSAAAVPLYKMFCQVTGYGGTTQRAEMAPEEASKEMITVRFDANVSRNLDWKFTPVQRSVNIHIGEEKLIFYKAENDSDKPVTGTATFNVTPEVAGKYFKKIQCFCFTEQILEPGEKADMSVSFFIDAGILSDPNTKHVSEITLSYTFFEKKQKTAKAVSTKNSGSL
ncbi:MAG: cytochrome c oxidase assembly protein [Hyphomicrobiaceae bacterium]|nr:cytochrome c oxidase assembly protein [Hyphomicrobiaceae bacterium]